MWNRLSKDEKGFTGLEAAIVLVAFVVVAAVFSYVMLGAGFYTTQKSQEVVHTGVAQASSSIAPSGDVIVRGDDTGGNADQITFYVANTAGGTAVDLDKTILTYTDNDDYVTQEYLDDTGTKGPVAAIPADAGWGSSNGWVYMPVIVTNNDNLLEKGEKYKVVVDLTQLLTDSSVKTLPAVNEQIKIEVKPPEGAVLTISRSLPAALNANNFYPVY